jgi:nitrogen regulatory protein PII
VKAVIVITDSEAMHDFERALLEQGHHGFTVLPTVWGRGRTGLKGGDRIHPGASSLLFSVVPDSALDATLTLLRAVRDSEGVPDETRIFTTSMDEVI